MGAVIRGDLEGGDAFEVAHAPVKSGEADDAVEESSLDLLGASSRRPIIQLRARPNVPRRCSQCGEIVVETNDVTSAGGPTNQ